MKKNISAIVLLVTLLLQTTLAIIPLVTIASAAGNVTINDFTCNITKGTVPLETRLSSNVTGDATLWHWSFYNPQTNRWSYSAASITTAHTFGAAGAYGVFNVTLEVWGPDGNDSLKKIDYVVANNNTTGLPISNFSASSIYGNAPLTVKFTDNSTDANSSLWYFGLTNTSTEKSPTYTFTSPGIYRVVLEVSNSNGWDATAQEITVQGQGKVLPVPNFGADTSNGLTVQFTDASQNATRWNWDFGDGTNSTEQSPTHNYSKAGDYIVSLAVSNENGTNPISKIINVQEGSSSSGGSSNSGSDNGGSSSGGGGGESIGSATIEGSSSSGGSSSGGGGGGGASPEPQSNVEAKELSQAFIGSGNSVNFNFPQNATPVMNISFDSKTTVGKTTTIVEMLINQSSLVSGSPSDEIYKFINIWVGNSGVITPDNIENAVVNFKVEKSWVQNKNIDKSSIILNRYNDTKWNALPTNLSGEDDKYLYFTAQTPGFSPFAITGKATMSGAVNETQSQLSTQSIEQNNTSSATNVEQTQSQSTSGNGDKKSPDFEAVVGIVGLLAVFLYKRK
jgi:PGF-pre-PGF domain-containing protein